jgi:hypothetical protein
MAQDKPVSLGAKAKVFHEAIYDDELTGWKLCFQWCRWDYWETETRKPMDVKYGYRFIWRRPDGSLQAARGQARLPSYQVIHALMAQAQREGWGELSEHGPHQK